MRSINVGIVVANDLIRSGIQSIISTANHDIQIVSCFQTMADCETYLNEQGIPILLIDDLLPTGIKLMEIVSHLYDRHPTMKIVILSNYLNEYYVQRFIDCGVVGFIYKDDNLMETLVSGIRTIAAGHIYLSPQASSLPYRRINDDILNQTDIAVLQLLAKGRTVQEIGTRLCIVARTVYRIRSRLRDYLNVRTNEQIVEAAKQRGLINAKELEA